MRKVLILISFIISTSAELIAQQKVDFFVSKIQLPEGHQVGIRGDSPPLSWYSSLKLSPVDSGYAVSLNFPDSVDRIEFKFVTFDDDSNPNWETNGNRDLVLEKESYSESIWDVEQFIDPETLEPIPSNGLLEDYELVEQMILDLHPGTYRFADSAKIKKSLAELKQKFSTPKSYGEAYLALSKTLSALECGHTAASLYNQNKIIKSVIHRQKDKMPFAFRWIEGKMVVTFDASSDAIIPMGTVIHTINGVEVEKIYAKMEEYIPSDGNTPKSRRAMSEIEAYDFRYDIFDVLYPLLYPLENEVLELSISRPEETLEESISLEYITRFDRTDILTERYPDFPKVRNDLISFEIINDHTGLLKIGSYGLMGWKRLTLDYGEFLKQSFAKLKKEKIANLIIDIRDNNGGNDEMLDELLTYLDVDRITIDDFEGRTRYLEFPENIKANSKSWGGDDPWYYHPDPKEKINGYYAYPEEAFVDQKNKKKGSYFKGNLYWLIGPKNASLAYYTASAARRFDLGLLVGEETGGNQQGINGGQLVFLTLPNSQIEIDFPIMGMFYTKDAPNQGILPDVEISQTLLDFRNGIDTQKQYILEELIQER